MDCFTLVNFPDIMLEEIFSYLSYDEIATHRIVCHHFDEVGKRLLNYGFRAVERFHSKCLKEVKSQLPRRESERRDHPLSHHCNILSGIETRLSLLNMTFLKYIDAKMCCFIPGKVIDEVYRVLWFVQETKGKFLRDGLSVDVRNNLMKEMRANVILKELRDISSMAMEHFEEKILPELKHAAAPSLATSLSSPSPPHFSLALPSFLSLSPVQGISRGKPSGDVGGSLDAQLSSLHWSMRNNKTTLTFVKKQIGILRHKNNDSSRKISEQEQVILEANRVISEQTSKLSEHETKLTESNQKILEMNRKLLENEQKMNSLFGMLSRHGLLHNDSSSFGGNHRPSSKNSNGNLISDGDSEQHDAEYFLSPPVIPMPVPGSPQPYGARTQASSSSSSKATTRSSQPVDQIGRCDVADSSPKHSNSKCKSKIVNSGNRGIDPSTVRNTRSTRKRTAGPNKQMGSKVKRRRH